MTINHVVAFRNQEEWRSWFTEHKPSQGQLDECIAALRREGIESTFFGRIAPEEIEITGPNLREKLKARGLNSRQRAVLELLSSEKGVGNKGKAKIYAPEAITSLALELRGRFPYFVGSEYACSREHADKLYPVPIEDLQSLSFKTGVFDAVVSCDVLEHIPDLSACLREMARVLKPGGVMISTHPFTWKRDSVIKAVIQDGNLVHLQEPEYHGNPVDPKGSLVFTVPGWDILNLCHESGFDKAEMVMIASTQKGIFASAPGFINVLRAYK